MEYRQLGRAGLRVSAIGLGGTTFGTAADEAQTTRILNRALDLGINLLDVSASYADGLAQQYTGKVVAKRRRDVVLSARLPGRRRMSNHAGPPETRTARAAIIEGVDLALRNFGTDYIDLWEAIVPNPGEPTMEEMLRTLDDLVRAGKIRYLGVSNYPAWQLVDSIHLAQTNHQTQWVATESRYNLLERDIERELVPACQAYNVGIIPFLPLAGGLLTGKYRRGEAVAEGVRGYNNPGFANILTDRNFDTIEALEGFATARGHTIGELALAWLLAKPQVCSVIVGATRPEQVEQNAKAFEWKLAAEELAEVDKLTQGD